MKARSFRRMLSAFLAVVMVLMTMPLSGIEVNAATTITTVNDMGKLGSGFNMLGDKYLGDAPMRQIFVSTSGITAQFDSNPVSKSSYSYITSVSDYFSNEAQTIKVGFGMGSEASAKLTIKIVELNLSQKYKLDLSYDDVTVNAYTVRSNFYQYGTATVTVIYSDGANDFVRYIPVHIVEESPTSVEIYMLPKTEFIVGDTFTYEGLALKLIYNNGSEKLLSSKSFTVTEPNMEVTGTQTVNISYEYAVGEIFTCAYNINVSPVSVVGIQITKLPDKLTYSQGEQIDLTGMQVTKIYNNGKTEVVSNNQLRTTYNFMNIGETTVVVNYSGFTANFQCTVTQIETDATITAESKNCSAGGTVQVPVVISNNPGIASVLLTVTYDESVLTLIEIEDTEVISGGNHSIVCVPKRNFGTEKSSVSVGGEFS